MSLSSGISMEEAAASLSGNFLLMDIARAKQAYLRNDFDLIEYECAIEVALERDLERNREAKELARARANIKILPTA